MGLVEVVLCDRMLAVFLVLCGVLVGSCVAHTTGINYVNWDGIKSCIPSKYSTPVDEKELLMLIRRNVHDNQPVKVVGGGLSFSGIQMTSNGGQMVSLDFMNKILNTTYFPDGSALVRVQAGIRVRELCGQLEALNLSMPNLGATATQSIVGAATTGTHGTGVNFGAIATQIHDFKLIDGLGNVLTASSRENSELFHAGRVGLGALGIIPEITLKVDPLFKLKKTTMSYSLQQLLIDLPSLMNSYERLQWSWTPYTDSATLILREGVDISTPITPEGGCWSTTASTANCTDVSYKALTDSEARYNAREIYTEMEMFIPIEYHIDAVNDYIAFMDSVRDQHDPANQLSVMLRYVAKDDIYLSPMYQRDTAVISLVVVGDSEHSANQTEFALYAQGLENLCESKYQGRVHWGKVSYANAAQLQKAFAPTQPDGLNTFDAFNAIRKQLDPNGLFMNEYLNEKLVIQ